jgi:predicted metalloprotease with PDZ domain
MRSRLAVVASFVAAFAVPHTSLLAQLHPVTCCNKGPVIVYDISFPNAMHHEANVKATFTALPAAPVNFRMARSSTGRYALAEFSKNVHSVTAVNSKGKALAVTHPDPYSWTVSGHDGTVTLSYVVYANVGSGTYPGFNPEQEHIQPQGTFVYVKGLEARPIRVTFHRLDPSWTIATQLVPTKDSETFTAPGMQYLFDSPTHLGNIQWREWTETHDGVKQTWRVSLDDPTGPQAIDAYADGARKIVHEAGAVYGEFPKFDYGTYTFVACYRSDCQSDGMEHRNSTSVTGNSMNGNGIAGLSTLAHEYFHSWNVKRIRPKGIEPFDYDRANMTDGLWIAEGFTQYYGPLLEERAGVTQAANTIRGLGNTINAVANSPGRLYFGPIGMSNQAPFRDGAAAADAPNPNTFISYYTYGAGIAIALDFSLRAKGKSLDDFMRTMWLDFGKPEIPYSMHDARHALITTSGDSAWAVDFWTRYVEGHDLPDYATLLDRAGIIVRKSAPSQPWIGGAVGAGFGGRGGRGGGRAGRGGAAAAPGDTTARVSSAPANSPLYAAGLDVGDVITSVDGKTIASSGEFEAALTAHKPGDRMSVTYTNTAGQQSTTITIGENPALQTVTYEDAGRTPSAEQLAFRNAWLASKAK